MIYEGNKTSQISFPLGGIGSGSIGLSGNGSLIDFEIFGSPNKRGYNGYSGFAVRAEKGGEVIDARLLQGDIAAPLNGEYVKGGALHSGFGFGPPEETLAGLLHFENVSFNGEFPVAELTFRDEKFPAIMKSTAWNPFIPLNEDDSSIPAALFAVELKNTSSEALTYTSCLFLGSPFPLETSVNKAFHKNGVQGVRLCVEDESLPLEKQGELAIATDCDNGSLQQYWYRGGWRDYIEMFWNDFTTAGPLQNRVYPCGTDLHYAHNDTACVAATVTLAPGEAKVVKFAISWSFPNIYNSWNPEADDRKTYWKHYYATKFASAEESILYCLENWERLYSQTDAFRKTLHGSALPVEVLDAVSANLSVLKSPTCLRLEDGSFYAFEGCISDVGCCEGSCTHVWNYAYALPFLFPKMERSMRDLEYKYSQREDGRTAFRLMLPLGRERPDFSACVDGQMGGVLKVYRDWKLCGDDEWLRKNWQAVKNCVEYAWAPTNEDKWDPEKTGVITGRQHHTLDMEFYGPSSWLEGFYLAALNAASELAEYLGETETAKVYRQVYEKGKEWTDKNLWNGSYFCEKIDLSDKSNLERFSSGVAMGGNTILNAYWNEENSQIKYQINDGCMIDQVLADWHTSLIGLPPVFAEDKTKIALRSLYKNNFKTMREFNNMWRFFALNDEKGLVICTWPEGAEKPKIPLTYAQECMTGFEYQAACHMILNGLVEEGLSIVKAVRHRYDGEKRNPWNELECGSNYARSMASYSLLLALSGFKFDAVRKHIGFAPIMQEEKFQSFWSTASAWGNVVIRVDKMEIIPGYGVLTLRSIGCNFANEVKAVTLDGENVNFNIQNRDILLESEITINVGKVLTLNA